MLSRFNGNSRVFDQLEMSNNNGHSPHSIRGPSRKTATKFVVSHCYFQTTFSSPILKINEQMKVRLSFSLHALLEYESFINTA